MKYAIVAVSFLALAACSDKNDETEAPVAKTENFTVKSSISSNPDPQVRATENAQVIDYMYDDDNVPADLMPGEAYRRGVPIDQARLDAKIARQKANPPGAATASPAPNVPAPAQQ